MRHIINMLLALAIYVLVMIQQSPVGGVLYDSFSIMLLPITLSVLLALASVALWMRGRESDAYVNALLGIVVGTLTCAILLCVRDEEGVLLIGQYMGLMYALVAAGALTCFNVGCLVSDEVQPS